MSAASGTPLRYARDNVLFGNDGQAAALYRLPSVSYALLPDSDKWAWLWTMAGLAFHAKADLSIWRVQRRWPADDYVPQAEGLVDARYQDPETWREFLAGHTPHIARLESHLPEVYLRISQRSAAQRGNRRGMLRSLDHAYRRVSEAFGVGPDAPIMESEIASLLEDEELLLDRVRRSLPAARRATPRELQWLCRRAAVRHVAEPQLDPWWQPNAMVMHSEEGLGFVPRSSDFTRLFNAAITREDDHLVIRGEEARTYQAFLTLGSMPDEVEFPGAQAEMMFRPLESLGFPVDAAMHCRWIANKKALSEVRKAVIDAENAVTEASTSTHTPDDRKILNPEIGRALEAYLKSEGRPPMLDASISFAVSADNLAELKRRTNALREQFTGVVLHQPAGLQERLYYEHLVRPGGSTLTDYNEMLTLEQFGMLMPLATRDVGSRRGPYVGYTVASGRPRSPVKLDLTAPSADALPTSIYLAGRQGSGKTNGALIFAHVAGAMRGSYVLTADPGPDHYITRLPELEGDTAVIGLDAQERYRGMLDPLVVTPEPLREEIAIDYYLDILPDSRDKGAWETELTQAVKAVMREDTCRGSLAVIEHLRNGNEAARELARPLTLISESGLGILAFGDGSNARGFDDIARVTTITMANLELPAANVPREQYDRRGRLAVATFKLVGAYIMWLVTHDRTVHKVVVLDEAWTFLETAAGRQLLDKLVRLGRKFNTTVIICSQTIGDLGELKKLIGMYFIFGVNSPEEASQALALIGLDPDDKGLCARLADKQQFAKGRCLHRDLEGRVAEMQVDAVYPHILQTLNTTPSPPKEGLEVAHA